MEVRVLGRRYFDIGILVNQSGPDIVPDEDVAEGRSPAFGPTDFRIDGEVCNCTLHQRRGAWRAINVDRIVALIIPFHRH